MTTEEINKADMGSQNSTCKYSSSRSGSQACHPKLPSWVWAAPPKTEDEQGEIRCGTLHAFVFGEVSIPQPRQQWPGLVGELRPHCCFAWDLFIIVTHSFPQPKVSGLPPWAGCLRVSDWHTEQNRPSFTELWPTQQVPSDKNTDDQKVMLSTGAFLTPETVKAGTSQQHPRCTKKSHLLLDWSFISSCILPWSTVMILGNDNKCPPHLHFHPVSSFLTWLILSSTLQIPGTLEWMAIRYLIHNWAEAFLSECSVSSKHPTRGVTNSAPSLISQTSVSLCLEKGTCGWIGFHRVEWAGKSAGFSGWRSQVGMFAHVCVGNDTLKTPLSDAISSPQKKSKKAMFWVLPASPLLWVCSRVYKRHGWKQNL